MDLWTERMVKREEGKCATSGKEKQKKPADEKGGTGDRHTVSKEEGVPCGLRDWEGEFGKNGTEKRKMDLLFLGITPKKRKGGKKKKQGEIYSRGKNGKKKKKKLSLKKKGPRIPCFSG